MIRTRYSVSLLQDRNIGEKFHLSLFNRFHPLYQLEEQQETVDQQWQNMKRDRIEACEDTCRRA